MKIHTINILILLTIALAVTPTVHASDLPTPKFISLNELEIGSLIYSPTSTDKHVWWYKAADNHFEDVTGQSETTFIMPEDVLFKSRFNDIDEEYLWRDSDVRNLLNNTELPFYSALSQAFKNAVVTCRVYTKDNTGIFSQGTPAVKETEDKFIIPSYAEYTGGSSHDTGSPNKKINFLSEYCERLSNTSNFTIRWSRSNFNDLSRRIVTIASLTTAQVKPEAQFANFAELDVWAGVNLKSNTAVCGPFYRQGKEYYQLFPDDDVAITNYNQGTTRIINSTDDLYSCIIVRASYDGQGNLFDVASKNIRLLPKQIEDFSIPIIEGSENKIIILKSLKKMQPVNTRQPWFETLTLD